MTERLLGQPFICHPNLSVPNLAGYPEVSLMELQFDLRSFFCGHLGFLPVWVLSTPRPYGFQTRYSKACSGSTREGVRLRCSGLAGWAAACHFPGMEWRTQRPAKRPGMIEPCIPTRASKPPVGPQWIHEIKHDGYRLIARKRDGRVRLQTRNGFDWTDRYPRIAEAVAALRTASATLDGEAVWCDGGGLAIFDKLHSRAHDGKVVLYAFDLLELHGEDLRPRPLEERKAKPAKLLVKTPAGIQYTEHLEGDGVAIFAHACKLGCEGIVSKHREHPYRSGPSKAWLKTKNPAAPGMLRFRDEP
jgi:bifunctional non-homologous end joining protein LigD